MVWKGELAMKRWANDIGPNLTKLRLRRGLTQEELAARLQIAEADMTSQVVANIEARRRRVYEDHIRGLIKVLRCDLNELFFGVPPATGSNLPTRSKPPRR
jgi:transcriptional regulator with XRE-family HTH domain